MTEFGLPDSTPPWIRFSAILVGLGMVILPMVAWFVDQLDAKRRATAIPAPEASLASATTCGPERAGAGSGQLNTNQPVLRYAHIEGYDIDAMQAALLRTALWQIGDARLVWVNEGDLGLLEFIGRAKDCTREPG